MCSTPGASLGTQGGSVLRAGAQSVRDFWNATVGPLPAQPLCAPSPWPGFSVLHQAIWGTHSQGQDFSDWPRLLWE
eukprot:386119-Pelagomonas_calceolata.AAC.1